MPPRADRLTDPKDPKYASVALARFLMCGVPAETEWAWARDEAFETAQKGQWFELRHGSRVSYMKTGESGRFSTERPEGVPDEAFCVLQDAARPPTVLRDYLERLADRLPADWRERMRARAQAMRAMDAVSYARNEVTGLLGGLMASQASAGPETAAISAYEAALRQRYLAFEMPAFLAGPMRLIARVARCAADDGAVSQALTQPNALNVFDPIWFVEHLLDKVAKLPHGLAWIAAASASLQEECETLHREAVAAPSLGAFYGAIFESAALALAGYRGFEFLARKSEGKTQLAHRRLAAICDERYATANAAISIDFDNALDWRALLIHRAKIAAARAERGEEAARLLARQYIDASLLYPPFFRPFLLGDTDTLTLKRRSAGEGS